VPTRAFLSIHCFVIPAQAGIYLRIKNQQLAKFLDTRLRGYDE
jgi:hypothetical protein